MNQNRHSCCCLDVRPCVLHLFLLCCFLTLWFVLCSLTNKRRRTRSETSFESCGHYVLKPLAFEFFSRCHPPYSNEEVVVFVLGFRIIRHEVFPLRSLCLFVLGLRRARLVPCFGAFGLEAQRAAFTQRTLCKVRCSHNIKQ